MEAIEAFNQPLTRSAATPAMKGLFTIDDQLKPLSDEKMERFVSVVMKLLWVGKRGRPDTELTTAFFVYKIIEVHRARLGQIMASFAFPTIQN